MVCRGPRGFKKLRRPGSIHFHLISCTSDLIVPSPLKDYIRIYRAFTGLCDVGQKDRRREAQKERRTESEKTTRRDGEKARRQEGEKERRLSMSTAHH